ncbi:MAG TPA: hemin uptake protein HemP [Hydrogenophaga sp.]|uniref:hemin uptake protein HemP n=1 Tax=Hydrogenophaga sp. TaxID=1904254 RepID=UPI002C6AE51E|nr:hemin uptake protein HemP [Hydrogenophaga sp.]HMN91645.1 hemin uptake protein HemP [Hydrogenophaga sp.]HMP09983.1 hemin uptake protein HemP [Hydrogenophaga sp.]
MSSTRHEQTASLAPVARKTGDDMPTTLTAAAVLDSQQVLQGHQAVTIAHNGNLYRLQATRQGKLILTK